MKKTKIICSIGPASCEADVMEKMVNAGMNIARFNFSHMTDDERNKNLESVKEVRKRTGANIAILWDTKGPEFRSGVLEGESIELVEGKKIRLVKDDVKGNQERITVNHPEALDSLEKDSNYNKDFYYYLIRGKVLYYLTKFEESKNALNKGLEMNKEKEYLFKDWIKKVEDELK